MKRPQVIALLVAAAFAVGVQNYLFFSSQPAPLRAVEEDDEEYFEDEDVESGTPLDTVARADIREWREQRATLPRNPFLTVDEIATIGRDEVQAARPVLSGTLWSPSRRVAWINGRPHSEGEWIGESRLERIDEDRVVLRRGIEVWSLGLNEAEVIVANEAQDEDG